MLEKQAALIKHLELDQEDKKPIYDNNCNRFEYGDQEYLVCTDQEADEEEEQGEEKEEGTEERSRR